MKKNENIETTLAASIPLAAYQALIRRPVIGLIYHAVSNDPPDYLKHIYPVKSPGQFEKDLICLKRNFNPISYAQLQRYADGKEVLPPRAVLISFDDGYRECFTQAAPLLRKHQVPCVFFLTTGFLDNRAMFYRNKYSLLAEVVQKASPAATRAYLHEFNVRYGLQLTDREGLLIWLRSLNFQDEAVLDQICDLLKIDVAGVLQNRRPYLTRAQVQGLVQDGFTIGAHSVHHPKFRDLPSEARVSEILASCRTVSSLTEMKSVPFAFPFSGLGVDRAWLAEFKRENAEVGLFFETQGLRPEPLPVFNRIWADPPPEPPQSNSNLKALIHQSYQEYILWRRKYFSSLIPHKLGLS